MPVRLWTALPPKALMWRKVVHYPLLMLHTSPHSAVKYTVFAVVFNRISHCKNLHCWSDAWFNNAKTTFPLELTALLKSHFVLSLYPNNECNVRRLFFAPKSNPMAMEHIPDCSHWHEHSLPSHFLSSFTMHSWHQVGLVLYRMTHWRGDCI